MLKKVEKKVEMSQIELAKVFVNLLNAELQANGSDAYWAIIAGSVCWYESPGPLDEENMMTFDDFISQTIIDYED